VLVLLCGPPFCGKSTVADLAFNSDSIIRPSDWMPDNYQVLGGDAVKDYRIVCWKIALEKTEESIEESDPSETIVVDQGNNKFDTAKSIIKLAKKHNHKIVLLYVNAKFALCKDRSGDDWIGDEIWQLCLDNIKESLPKYKKACDKFVIVDNNDDIDMLSDKVGVSCAKIQKLSSV
jgi:predicted kinase